MAAKGGNWERDVCKFLSWWINGTQKPYVFWRSGGSGSVFTVSNGEAGEEFSGDIYAVREEGSFLTQAFTIECKNGYADASLDKHLKYNRSDPLKSFWEQTMEDAVKSGKYPMLIFKKKGFSTPWLGINNNTKKKLSKHLDKIRFLYLHWEDDLSDVYFFEYKEFFNSLSPEVIKNIK